MSRIKSLNGKGINTSTKLEEIITYKREELIETALIFGLNHKLTIEKSKALDTLLNQYSLEHKNK